MGYGITLSEKEIEFALEQGILEKVSKTKISFKGKMEWKNKREFYDLYKSKNKLLPLLYKKIYAAYKTKLKKEIFD